MTDRDHDGDWPAEVVEALRRKAARPSSMTPAEAARRVGRRLESPRPRRRRWLVPAAVTAAVLLALTSVRRPPREPVAPPARAVPVARAGPAGPAAHAPIVIGPLPDNVVLWWLDPETPVYFVLAPPAPRKGGSS